MGNCMPSHGSGRVSAELISREKFTMVTRPDGKIMEYTAPLLVRDLMAAYPQHSVVHSKDPTCRSLSPDEKLVSGQLYSLLLIPNSPPPLPKDGVLSEAKSIDNGRFEGTVSGERCSSTRPPSSVKCVENGGGVIRVKMVISKRELEAFLSDRSMKEKSSLLPRLQSKMAKEDYGATRKCCSRGWRPLLEDIPEII
uniref:DUF4228 domain-containing protein n=1 Tax=Picea sitchensis TaxID=3332 RepID=D5AD58_PICSI|nr:unknown [Picea sitchensis]